MFTIEEINDSWKVIYEKCSMTSVTFENKTKY